MKKCPKCGKEMHDSERLCINCGFVFGYDDNPNREKPILRKIKLSEIKTDMTWYKFLAFFLYFYFTVRFLIQGIEFIGKHFFSIYPFGFQEIPEYIFIFKPSLGTYFTIIGIASLVLAAYSLFTAISLLRFKRYAPLLVHISFLYGCVLDILAIITYNKLNAEFYIYIGDLCFNILFLICSYSFFTSKSDIFIR